MSNRIVFLVPAHAGTLTLADGVVTTVGRGSDNKIQVSMDSISRHHLRIDTTLHICLLEDLGSTNGTFVNGKQISRYELKHNDVIQMGGCQFRYEHIEMEQSEEVHGQHVDYSDRTQESTIKIKSFKPEEGRAAPADIRTEKGFTPVAPLTFKKKE